MPREPGEPDPAREAAETEEGDESSAKGEVGRHGKPGGVGGEGRPGDEEQAPCQQAHRASHEGRLVCRARRPPGFIHLDDHGDSRGPGHGLGRSTGVAPDPAATIGCKIVSADGVTVLSEQSGLRGMQVVCTWRNA